MILNGKKIEALTNSNILIKNCNKNNIHSSSYDVTTDEYILKFKETKEFVHLGNAGMIENMYERIDIKNGYKLSPQECILVVLKDEFNMPNNICGSIRGRTSYNRLGVSVFTQHLNPGYKGKLNITITNNSTNTYIITPNMQIAQAIFEEMDADVDEELLYYNEKNAYYQDNNGIQGSKVYTNYIGKVVRHFKGNYYYIENICMNSEDKEFMVVYRTLYDRTDSNFWTRPAKMFFEEISVDRKDNITKQKHRFEVVDDLTIDYTKKK